jgi:hypothetical protein
MRIMMQQLRNKGLVLTVGLRRKNVLVLVHVDAGLRQPAREAVV